MKLKNLLNNLSYKTIQGSLELEISQVTSDSRKVEPRAVFVAIKGFELDGSKFIPKAVENGAIAIIIEKEMEIEELPQNVTILEVGNTRVALACLSHNFYNKPTEKIHMVGVTGTNGKTSITTFLDAIIKAHQKKAGIIGTLGAKIGKKFTKTGITTPESNDIQRYASQMVKAGLDYLVIEASSHSLELHRVDCCDFNDAIFTNLSPDHLELHKTMEAYFEAKALLFEMASDNLIINIEDDYGQKLFNSHKDKAITYGINHPADIRAEIKEETLAGSKFDLITPKGKQEVYINLPGEIFVMNALAAAAWAYTADIPLEVVAKGLNDVKAIKGRMELVHQDDDNYIVIDFAHTEDGLKKVLESLRPFTKNRLILVFGVYSANDDSGHDKRKGMAKVAAGLADYSIVTSDNPKFYDPQEIVKEISGYIASEGGKYCQIVDREEAIKFALKQLLPGDVLLIAGKGHETTQNIAGKEIPFSESDIVKRFYQAS